MNVFTLKLIALITMIIDHYGAIFKSGIEIYRIVGRVAFPIYCFLLVEGYFHTRDVKRYAKRLGIFALISEIPFDLAFYGKFYPFHQNIFFTLFIGLVTIYLLDNKEKYNINNGFIFIASGLISIILSVDYSFIGIIYILAFYYSKKYPKNTGILWAGVIIFIANVLTFSVPQQYALLALPLIYFYNGKLGPKNKFIQMSFYITYPLHLIIFYLVKYY